MPKKGGVMFKKNQVVRFLIGRESFGIDIGHVQEIVVVPEITKVPDTPDFIEGIINLRGKIVSVIDLRKRLRVNGIQNDKKNRILVSEVNGRTVGLIVDEVSEVLRLNPDNIEPPPEIVNSVGAGYITSVGKLEDKIILLLDLGKVLDAEEMSKLNSQHNMAVNA